MKSLKTRRFRCGIWLALAGCVGSLFGGAAAAQEAPAPEYRKAVLIRFEGMISPLLESYVNRKLTIAEKAGADLLILEIDSPGGFLDTSLNLADRFRDLDWAHTVAYVPREALSGAAIIALGCDEIVMAKKAHLGDAGPIFQGEDALFRHAPEKIRSELVLRVRDLAEAKGRPPALAEAMVDMDLVVYPVRNKANGEETFMSDREIEHSDEPNQWEKGKEVEESRKSNFLTVTGERAIELKLAEGLAGSRDDLKKRYALGEDLLVLEPTAIDTAVTILNIPFVTGVLLVIGLIAVYFEFSAPGLGAGGLVAALCFTLFFWSKFLGGTAVWLEVLLFALGIVFVLIEVFVIPGFGFSGVTGLALMLVSMVMASQHFGVPDTTRELNTTLQALLVIVGAGFAFLCGAFVLSHYFHRVPVLGMLTLELPGSRESDPADDGKAKTVAPLEHVFPVDVGDWGVADSPLRPAGKATFGDAYVDVVADGSFVDQGRQVRVIEISGNRVVVREVDEPV